MGVPLTLRDIQSGFLSASAFNANNSLTEAALNRAVDRLGGPDNAMEADFDMGMNYINNVLMGVFQHQGVNLGQVRDEIAAVSTDITATTDIEDRIFATAGQTVVNLTYISYLPGTNSIIVYKNGIYQRAVWEYEETDETTITFNDPLSLNDEIDIFGAKFDATLFAEIAQEGASTTQTHVDETTVLLQEVKDAAGYKLNVNTQTGTSYTLTLDDEGDLIRMTNSLDNTVTVPADSTVDYEIGSIVLVRQVGSGLTTIVPAAGVAINAAGAELTTAGEEFGIGLVKVGPNEYDLVRSYSGVSPDELTNTSDGLETKITDIENSLAASNTSLQADIDAAESDITTIQNQLTLPGLKSTNGYQYLPGGLILQWGRYTVGAPQGNSTIFNIPFTIGFPTACIHASLSDTSGFTSDAKTDEGMSILTINNTSIDVYQGWKSWPAKTDGLAGHVLWFAIGY